MFTLHFRYPQIRPGICVAYSARMSLLPRRMRGQGLYRCYWNVIKGWGSETRKVVRMTFGPVLQVGYRRDENDSLSPSSQ